MSKNEFFKVSHAEIFGDEEGKEEIKEAHYQNWIVGILKLMKVKTYMTTEVLCHKGDQGSQMFFIVDGTL